MGTLRRFYQSDDPEVLTRHVPRPAKPLDFETMEEIRYHCALSAQIIWHYQAQAAHPLPLGHDGYVKLWANARPRLDRNYSFLMVDEAQDLNPVLIGVIRNQGCQVVAVGDGHQQIYAWRGAVDALKQLPGAEFRLTQSFRFGSNIAAFADRLLVAMGERFTLHGNGWSGDVVRAPEDETADAMLCRTNASVISNLADMLEVDMRVYIAGGTSELLRLIDDARRLQRGQPAETAELLGFTSWAEVEEYADTDEGAGLKVFVRLVATHGVGELQRLLGRVLPSGEGADVTLSTAHKAKGLEWSSVELSGDFMRQGADAESQVSLAERRLFYVAATRAKSLLLVDPVVAAAYHKPMTTEEAAAA
jgi:hypothetical protein